MPQYRFTINDGSGDTTVTPLVDSLKKRFELDGQGRFYLRKMNDLLFVGDDYTVFKDLYDWNFATKRLALADTNNPPPDWQYAYQYPTDCVRITEIMVPGIS